MHQKRISQLRWNITKDIKSVDRTIAKMVNRLIKMQTEKIIH